MVKYPRKADFGTNVAYIRGVEIYTRGKMENLVKKVKEAFEEISRDFRTYLFIMNFARKHR